MTVKLIAHNALNLKQVCSDLLEFSSPKIRTVAKVIGLMVASFPMVEHGQLFKEGWTMKKLKL